VSGVRGVTRNAQKYESYLLIGGLGAFIRFFTSFVWIPAALSGGVGAFSIS